MGKNILRMAAIVVLVPPLFLLPTTGSSGARGRSTDPSHGTWPVAASGKATEGLLNEKKPEANERKNAAPALPKPLLSIPCPESANCLAFSPDGKKIAVASCDVAGKIRFFETATGKALKPVLEHPAQALSPLRIAFSPDGALLASTRAFFPGEMRLWDWEKQVQLAIVKNIPRAGAPVFDPKGNRLAFTESGNVVFFDLSANAVVEKLPFITPWLNFSADGKKMAVVTGNNGQQLEIWNFAEKKVEGAFKSENGFVGLACSTDGKTIGSAAADDVVNLWQVGTEKPVKQFKRKVNADPVLEVAGFLSLQITSDGKYLGLSGVTRDGAHLETQFWNSGNGKSVFFKDHGHVIFSPNGKLAATSDNFKRVAIWDLKVIEAVMK